MEPTPTTPGPLDDPVARRREHRAWYAYDAANSAFTTSVITVFAGPYLTALAEAAADPANRVHLLGIPIAANSWFLYVISASVLGQAFVLPLIGAYADRSPSKPRMLSALVLAGSLCTVALVGATEDAWLLGGVLLAAANVLYGASIVVYDSLLPEIALPGERDAVSSRGWACGYAGAGFVLLAHLVLFLFAEDLGITDALAARTAIATSGLWWLALSAVTLRGVHPRPGRGRGLDVGRTTVAAAARELRDTFRELRRTPLTLRFLAGYLLYNDGVQTVIAAAAVFGSDELGLQETVLIGAILVVQVVALFGALATGRIAAHVGAKRTVLGSLVIWTLVVSFGRTIPAEDPVAFTVLAACIGLVLGGVQALSRSMFSQLVPPGREAEYFGIYQLSDRGTSWLGTFVLGLAVQVTGTYRSGIIVLLAFFVLGGGLLAATDMRKAIAQAGNDVPELV